jgi:hypothetical protein
MTKREVSVLRASTPRPRILVTADASEETLAALRELGNVEYASFRETMRLLTGSTLAEALREVEVFVSEIDVIDASVIQRSPDLRSSILRPRRGASSPTAYASARPSFCTLVTPLPRRFAPSTRSAPATPSSRASIACEVWTAS